MAATLDLELLPKQIEIFNDPSRFKIVACGRRFGKTTLAAIIVTIMALKNPDSTFFIVSPTFSQSDIMWSMIKRLFHKNEAITPYIKQIREGVRCIELINGSTIWSKSGDNPDSLRGEGLDGVVLDEAAMLKPDVWHEAILPALLDKGGWGMMIGTPKGKNWYYHEYLRGLDASQEDYCSFHYTSYDNPILKSAEIDALRQKMPELAFRQEILAEFVEGGGVVFRDVISHVAKPSMKPLPGHVYIAGIDLSRYTDFTVVNVVDASNGKTEGFYRWNDMKWDIQRARIEKILRAWNRATAVIDTTGIGQPLVEDLMASADINVVPINLNVGTKPQIIENYTLFLENSQITIPDDPVVILEHESYAFEITMQTSKIRFGAPSGFHDDTVMAAALAAWGLHEGVSMGIGFSSVDKKLSKYADMEGPAEWSWQN